MALHSFYEMILQTQAYHRRMWKCVWTDSAKLILRLPNQTSHFPYFHLKLFIHFT